MWLLCTSFQKVLEWKDQITQEGCSSVTVRQGTVIQTCFLLLVYRWIICCNVHSWDQLKHQVAIRSSPILYCKYLKYILSNAESVIMTLFIKFCLDHLLLSFLFMIILEIASDLGASACAVCTSLTICLIFTCRAAENDGKWQIVLCSFSCSMWAIILTAQSTVRGICGEMPLKDLKFVYCLSWNVLLLATLSITWAW